MYSVHMKHDVMAKITPFLRKKKEEAIVHLHNAVSRASFLVSKTAIATRSVLTKIVRCLSGAGSNGYLYYRHSLPVRIMHWCNVVLLAILLMSGLNIFNAHPALYWGEQSYTGTPPVFQVLSKENDNDDEDEDITGITLILGREFNTTGFLGASRESSSGDLVDRGFPSWITVPDWQWLSMARRWHFFFAWLLVINGLAFVIYAIAGGHVRRDLIPTKQDWRSIGRTILDHLLFRHPKGEASKRYNVLQKCAYLGVIFFVLPLMITMGLGMSPALDAVSAGWVDFFAGRQSVRTIHFIVAWIIVLFVIVHVFMVIVSGFMNNLRSMITGSYRVKPEVDHE
ncbi:MAG TPA: cytochrome b/b6 domain-containing protein [Syntrophales bacterium]|nr:cytochrome b/b6 domain-containing protein [Syntrophales bacterium]